jgi:septum site-determining protein MinC
MERIHMERATKDTTVTIRGTEAGLLISLGDSSFEEALADLEALLTSRASFFLGGRAALHVGGRRLTAEQLSSIGHMVEQFGMTLWAVQADHTQTQAVARELGLETSVHPVRSSARPKPAEPAEMPGIVARRTLRSGQVLQHAGHITLLGDVNPGAEIIAAGDVFVWGKLRGTVHAGATGDEGAIVCALQLAPSQIRIGSHIARSPERSRLPEVPELASVQQGSIVVERWRRRQEPER